MVQSNKFVTISLTYNYPDDYVGVDDDSPYEEDVFYNTGNYGRVIISLVDPKIFVVTEEGENSSVSYYIEEGVIPLLGSGPHTIGDVQTNAVEDALSRVYSDDVRTGEAYITMIVKYVDWSEEHKAIEVSEKMKELVIPGISPLELLKIMEIRGIF